MARRQNGGESENEEAAHRGGWACGEKGKFCAFLFKFEKEEEYNRILRGRPWSINGSLLNLMERSSYKSCEDFVFSHCPIWVQVHSFPLEALRLENAVMIGGYVGEVVLAEDPQYNGRYLRNFLRARVVLDLKKTLAYGFWLPKPDGSSTWILIQYEKLPIFCYHCGKVSHDNRTCKSEKLMSRANVKEPRYGPWLSTNVCRSWEEVMVVVRDDWSEARYVQKKREEALHRRQREDRQTLREDSARIASLLGISVKMEVSRRSGMGAKVEVVRLAKVGYQSEERDIRGAWEPVQEPTKCTSDILDDVSVDSPQGSLHKPSPSVIPQAENPLTIIPFNSKILNEVINVLDGLGLKRHAEDDLGYSATKKRKTDRLQGDLPVTIITSYADTLKRAKEKARSAGKRRCQGGKENLVLEELDLDEDMSDQVVTNPGESTFVFKAKRGRKKKQVAEDPVGSDHHALVVDCCFCDSMVPKSFKFEANWIQHEDYIQIVEKGWNVAEGIASDRLRKELSLCYEGPFTNEKLGEAEALVQQIEEAWGREETYWWQRSRISWLSCGDRNTKFFHNSVIQRRQRNKVLKLRNANGVWLEDKKEIHGVFSNYYKDLFSTGGPRQMDQALTYVKKVVSNEDNTALTQPITN
ncbi:hypothetical protein K1719_038777 [Acacia pycnantha]|nr:hypothetical protein K1719_038777 [Acacia pycnantha]